MFGDGALALTTAAGSRRATAQTADTKPFRIDVHHHLSPPTYVTASNEGGFDDPLMKNWTRHRYDAHHRRHHLLRQCAAVPAAPCRS
jgi:hypothetical protein